MDTYTDRTIKWYFSLWDIVRSSFRTPRCFILKYFGGVMLEELRTVRVWCWMGLGCEGFFWFGELSKKGKWKQGLRTS